jgi:hypothetical protein
MYKGRFILNDDDGNEQKSGEFSFLQEIARFAPVPRKVNNVVPIESWLVSHTGRVEVDFGTGNDNVWQGRIELYLNDKKSVKFDAKQVRAIRYTHGPPRNVISQTALQRFGPLAVMVALGGMHTGDESQSTYGIRFANAWILGETPSVAPPNAPLRPQIEIGFGVWGDDAHLHSLMFHLTVNAMLSSLHAA